MKIIVTGANGFLGKTFCENLVNTNVEVFAIVRQKSVYFKYMFGSSVTVIECDLGNYSKTKAVFDSINPDVVYHFAANPSVKDSRASVIETNVVMTDKILRCCGINKSNFVFASSATVYGDSKKSDAESFNVDSELCPESLYAVSKVQCEELVKFYNRAGIINNYLTCRFVANVGRNATHGVLFDIIHKIKNSKESIDVIGCFPGTSKPFTLASQSTLYAFDYANTIFSDGGNDTVNISPNDHICVNDLVDIILDEMGESRSKNWLGTDSMWQGDQNFLKVSSKLSKELYSSPQAIRLATKELMELT